MGLGLEKTFALGVLPRDPWSWLHPRHDRGPSCPHRAREAGWPLYKQALFLREGESHVDPHSCGHTVTALKAHTPFNPEIFGNHMEEENSADWIKAVA